MKLLITTAQNLILEVLLCSTKSKKIDNKCIVTYD